MQKTTVQKLKRELERLAKNSDPRVVEFLRKMQGLHPELAK